MSKSAPLVTADELERFPDDDYRYELVEGRVIRMSPVGFEHGRIVPRLTALLHRHVEEHHLGAIVNEVGFKLASNPDTVRAPDIAFLRLNRIPRPDPRGFIKGGARPCCRGVVSRRPPLGGACEDYGLPGFWCTARACPQSGRAHGHRLPSEGTAANLTRR